MSADYPNKKLVEKHIPASAGHLGTVIDSGIEGRQEQTETIGTNSRAKNKKSASMVGATNVSHT